eukprot:807338-Pleurochrysis_carterae.AAC.1
MRVRYWRSQDSLQVPLSSRSSRPTGRVGPTQPPSPRRGTSVPLLPSARPVTAPIVPLPPRKRMPRGDGGWGELLARSLACWRHLVRARRAIGRVTTSVRDLSSVVTRTVETGVHVKSAEFCLLY